MEGLQEHNFVLALSVQNQPPVSAFKNHGVAGFCAAAAAAVLAPAAQSVTVLACATDRYLIANCCLQPLQIMHCILQ